MSNRNRENPAVTCQVSDSKHKEPGWLLGSMNRDVIMTCVDDIIVICASVQTAQLCAQNSLAVVKTKIELDPHADTFVVSDHF